MSKISLAPNISGSATFTIAAPNSSTDRTLTLPDSTGTIATAESTLTQFNASGSAPVYACRAWVNFNGTGTVAIRASGNVSSITDISTGVFTINFTTAMPDANYVAIGIGDNSGNTECCIQDSLLHSTTQCKVVIAKPGVSAADPIFAQVAIFR